ncbi:MAG TPA: putative Ig domain-containing protein, partial [Bryobacteraceae bacterium]|nr:putative Ig domain-containing protein [Bryobacteraceae bacterium]
MRRFAPVFLFCLALCFGQTKLQSPTQSQTNQAVNVVKVTLARAIVAGDPCNARTASESSYVTSDPFVWLVLSYSGVASDQELVVEWVQPSEKVYYSQPIKIRATNNTPSCVSATLAVAGEPPAAMPGNWKVRLKAQDTTLVQGAFKVELPKRGSLSVISSSVLPEAVQGGDYTHQLAASGGTAPYTWSAQGDWPADLKLRPTGEIHGRPTTVGSYKFQAVVSDSAGKTATHTFAVAVAEPDVVTSPRTLSFSLLENEEGSSQKIRISSTGAKLPVTLRIPPGASWLTAEPASGTTPFDVVLRAAPNGRTPGNYTAAIDLRANNQQSGYVNVKMKVGPKSLSGSPQPLIDTLVGNSWKLSSSGHGLDAPVSEKIKLAVDPQGRLLIADTHNHVVFRLGSENRYEIIAGTGIPTSSGDGGRARDASFNAPSGIAVDQQGNIYVSEAGAHRVRVITPDGTIRTFAGTGVRGFGGDTGVAVAARFDTPTHLGVDKNNNVYVVDSGNYVVRRISPSRIVTTVAGNGEGGNPGKDVEATKTPLGVVDGMAVTESGDIYLASSLQDRIRRVQGGMISDFAGGGTSTLDGETALRTLLRDPTGLAFDNAGNLLVCERSLANRILRIEKENRVWVFAGGPLGGADNSDLANARMRRPDAVAADGSGKVYFADSGNLRVRVIDTVAKQVTTLMGNSKFRHADDGAPVDFSHIFEPAGLAKDPAGNLYISESGNHRILMLRPDGTTTAIAGTGSAGSLGDTNHAANAELNNPQGLAFSDGFLYVADQGNDAIRRMQAGGFIRRYPEGRNVAFNNPTSIVFDKAGNLYVSETGAHKVSRISAEDGSVTVVAGDGRLGFAGDGGPATSARLHYPKGLAIDSKGDLYIADDYNHRIRRVSNGNIETVAGTGTGASSGDGGDARSAALLRPIALAFDGDDNLYIAEYASHSVRKIEKGIIRAFAGTPRVAGYDGDGGAATRAKLARPTALL